MYAEWYYVDGTPYCAECVERGGPAIAAEDATRGPAPSGGRCACCGETHDQKIDARLESRADEGTGWYVYVNDEDAGGPFETEAEALSHWSSADRE